MAAARIAVGAEVRGEDTREIVVAPRRSTAKESTITCVSVTGPVASRHYDLIIADDIVDEENSRTELQR